MITARQLSYERYFSPVFEPVSFRVAGGELLRVTGANGSGKTTLIRLLAGILTPADGDLVINARRIAWVGHQLAVKDDLSVVENLAFMQRFLGGGGISAAAALHELGLRHVAHQLARTLSAGQRNRCALARLLLAPADLWLPHEPYASLDAEGCGRLDRMIREHTERAGACVLATHGAHRPDAPAIRDRQLQAGRAA